ATAKVQTVNGVRQLQALVDKKTVIVTESSIRRDLYLYEAEGTIVIHCYYLEELTINGEDSNHPTDTTPIPIIRQPSSTFPNPKETNHQKGSEDNRARDSQLRQEHDESIQNTFLMIHNQVKLDSEVKKRKKMSRPTGLKRLRKIGMTRRVESSEDQESLGAPKDASKQKFLEEWMRVMVEAKDDGTEEQRTKA
ncbi:hypothetical protein Tco_0741084, partial [Tanacetum coccineum]